MKKSKKDKTPKSLSLTMGLMTIGKNMQIELTTTMDTGIKYYVTGITHIDTTLGTMTVELRKWKRR